MEDGGYYAIKGFEYQVDKMLLDILSCSDVNQPFYLEKIEDINTDAYVMQVKYKEAAKFFPSSIKKPVKQLLDLFRLDSSKDYKLYCYFQDLNGYDTSVTLKEILGKESDKYSDSDIQSFKEKFELIFSKEFQNQFDSVNDSIISNGAANSRDTALIVYSNLVDFLRKLVVNNDSNNKDLRKCTKRQLLVLAKESKKLLFDEGLLIYYGREDYFKLVRKSFTPLQKHRRNFIFIGEVQESMSLPTAELLIRLVNKHYANAIVNTKPLTFIMSDKIIDRTKKAFISEKISFNDGYESISFSESIFYETPVTNRKVGANRKATNVLERTSFKVRLVSYSAFDSIINHEFVPAMSYLFDEKAPHTFNSTVELKVERLDTSEIAKLFKL